MKKKSKSNDILPNPISQLQEAVKASQAILAVSEKYKIHREGMYEAFPALKAIEEQFQAFDQRIKNNNEKWNEEHPEQANCDHGVIFDEEEAKYLLSQTSEQSSGDPAVDFIMGAARGSSLIRKRWPRLMGPCPKGCGFNGIAYASAAHYAYGDW